LWRSGVIAYFQSLEPCLVGMEACATAHHWAREVVFTRPALRGDIFFVGES
jgi:hypothetical protein